MGAIATGGVRVLNDDVVRGLRIPPEVIDAGRPSARAASWRGGSAPTAATGRRRRWPGRTVILVDDGLATGATMRAAVGACAAWGRPGSSSPCRSPRRVDLRGAPATRSTRSSAPRRRSRSTRSGSGTRTSRRRPTRRSATCSRGAPRERRPPDRPRPGIPDAEVRPSDPLSRRSPGRATARGPGDYDALLDLVGDARFVLLGEASHGTHEFYAERAPDHPAADRGEGLQRRRRRGRLARRLPRQPLRPRPRRRRRRPTRRCAASGASRPGCGATPTCSTSSAGCASTTTGSRRRAGRRPASTAWTSTACTPRSRRSSPTSTRSTRRRPARARDRYACFDHFGEDAQAYGYAASLRRRPSRARTRWSTSSSSSSAAPPSTPRRDGLSRRGRVLLRRAERPPRQERRGVLPRDVPAAGSRRGTCATGTWPRRSTRSSSTSTGQRGRPTKVVVWAHNSHLGDARATEMGEPGRAGTSASSSASATAATRG